jgi:hypothetical protein
LSVPSWRRRCGRCSTGESGLSDFEARKGSERSHRRADAAGGADRGRRTVARRLVTTLCSVRPSGRRDSYARCWPSGLARAFSTGLLMALDGTQMDCGIRRWKSLARTAFRTSRPLSKAAGRHASIVPRTRPPARVTALTRQDGQRPPPAPMQSEGRPEPPSPLGCSPPCIPPNPLALPTSRREGVVPITRCRPAAALR